MSVWPLFRSVAEARARGPYTRDPLVPSYEPTHNTVPLRPGESLVDATYGTYERPGNPFGSSPA